MKMTFKPTGADARQHGGTHYKGLPPELEHWNVVAALGWDYYIGTATKYLWRLGKKDDPIVEIEKAVHYLQKKLELLKAERVSIPVMGFKIEKVAVGSVTRKLKAAKMQKSRG